MQILITEDELPTRLMLRFVLERQAGYRVTEAASGEEALRILTEQQCGLLLADLSLPDMDGLELVRRVRRTSNIPIIIVSARVDIPDRVRGLKCGADDYVAKPFDVSELLARVDALLWRAAQAPKLEGDGKLTVGPLRLEPQLQTVEVDGKGRVRLTPTEFRLLFQLAKAPGQVRTRAELERAIGGEEIGTAGALNTYISNLRHKLEPDPNAPRLIQTVRAQGYRLAV